MTRAQWIDETEWHGCYPAVLTTDGTHYEVEFRNNYSGWKPTDTVIEDLSCSDHMPSFSECERRRRAVKAGRWTTVSDWLTDRDSAAWRA